MDISRFTTERSVDYIVFMKISGRNTIIDAATEMIAFSGLDKLTMQSLSEELGLKKASLYHWFRSKEEIMEAVFIEGHRKLMARGFRLNLEGAAGEVLERAAASWTEIFTADDVLPYLRVVFSLRYSDQRAEEEARALRLMIKSQIDVIISSLGFNDNFLSQLFSSLLLQHLELLLEGEEADFRQDAASFAGLLMNGGEQSKDSPPHQDLH